MREQSFVFREAVHDLFVISLVFYFFRFDRIDLTCVEFLFTTYTVEYMYILLSKVSPDSTLASRRGRGVGEGRGVRVGCPFGTGRKIYLLAYLLTSLMSQVSSLARWRRCTLAPWRLEHRGLGCGFPFPFAFRRAAPRATARGGAAAAAAARVGVSVSYIPYTR